MTGASPVMPLDGLAVDMLPFSESSDDLTLGVVRELVLARDVPR